MVNESDVAQLRAALEAAERERDESIDYGIELRHQIFDVLADRDALKEQVEAARALIGLVREHVRFAERNYANFVATSFLFKARAALARLDQQETA